MATLAPKLPYTHPFAGGYPYRGSQRLPSDPDALTYLAAVAAADGAPVETAVAVAVDDFFKGCKADGIWDAIKASCLLCGARTLAGALVPLKNEGPELVDIDNLPTPTVLNFGGTAGYWDAASKTMHSPVVAAYVDRPRFIFNFGLVSGHTYKIVGRFVGDISDLNTGERVGPGITIGDDGVIDTTFTADGSAGIRVTFNANFAQSSLTIESLSIREVIAAPTNVNNNFVDADYNRETGLKGNGSTKYLDSGRADDADPQDDAHRCAYVSERGVNAVYDAYIGVVYSSPLRLSYIMRATDAGGRLLVFERDSTGASQLSGSQNQEGFLGCARSSSASFLVRAGGSDTTFSIASSAPVAAANSYVFARNSNGSANSMSTGRIAFYSIGEAIDLEALDARVTALVQRIQLSLSTGLDVSGYDDATVAYLLAAYNNGATLE